MSYFRHGADWNKFLENWKKINHENISKKIYITICNYNVWYVLDLYKELHLNNIFDIGYDFVHNPKELNISFLNDKIKNEIIKKYENDDNKVWNKLSVAEKEVGGIPNTSEDIKQAHAAAIEMYINDHVGLLQDGTYGTMYFNDTLNDWSKFDINKRTKHDASISS